MFLALSVTSHLLLLFLCLVCGSNAQDFNIPQGWANTLSNDSYADRQAFAWGAAKELTLNIDNSTGRPSDVANNTNMVVTVSNMVIVLASQDWRSGNVSWKHPFVDNALTTDVPGHGAMLDNKSNAVSGLAEIAAYLAYNDSAYLEAAMGRFDIASGDFVNASAIESGAYPRKFNTTCGSKLAGVLFSDHANTTDLMVEASVIGPWIVLAARLYEITRNSTYLAAAKLSIDFMSTNLVTQVGAHTFVDGSHYDVTTCKISDGGTFNADDLGPYIEGLSIVANITQTGGNGTYADMLYRLIPVVVTLSDLQTPDGILSPATIYFTKGYLIRALLEARLRHPSNNDLITLIDRYLTIQYNAVRTNAFVGNDNYKIYWTPGANAPISYNTIGSIDAVDVFNAASAVALDPANSSESTRTTKKDKRVATAIIVGATVGSVAVIAAFIVGLCVLLRRRRRCAVREMPIDDDHVYASDIQSKTSLLETGMELKPFLPTPSEYDRQALTISKGAVLSYARLPSDDLFEDPSDPFADPSDPLADGANGESIVPNAPPDGDRNALHAIEMRLEMRLGRLVHNLVNYGETVSNPPEYEDGDRRRSSHHEEFV